MQKPLRTLLGDEEWTTIRDFSEHETGYDLPKYEAKFVKDVEQQFLEDELVLVKRTSSIDGGERMYHFPREVFEGVVDRLP